ncbi:UNVERIFIED_ORG: hypothetical protein BTE55_10285 [Rhizobium sophorae]|uniref:hypothetical protein n=1 Tax=Rhizobium sophoriradicis TaxID=1535245 RepID=UPI0009902A24|nr:hypothetical protein [Rhizobium sophoriradicis]
MAEVNVRLRAVQDCEVEGVRLQPGDFAGVQNSRPSVNHPNGQKIEYVLHTVAPVRQGDAIVTEGKTLNRRSLQ